MKVRLLIKGKSNYILCVYIIYPPPCPWHEVGVFGHRAKRVRRCQYPTINDVNDLRCKLSMMDWSTIVIRAARPSGHLPANPRLACLKSLFWLPTSASKLDSFSKPQNPTFDAPNPPKTLPKTLPKRLPNSILCSNTRNVQKWYHYYTKTTFWLFSSLQKSSQNRCQNAFKVGPLGIIKIRFLMLNNCQQENP